MASDQAKNEEIAQFISRGMKEQFDATLSSVAVMIKKPFLVIHLNGFLLPTEEFLLQHGKVKELMETRDLLLNGWKPEIRKALETTIGEPIEEIYMDWNLENRTGLLMAVMQDQREQEIDEFPDNKAKKALRERVDAISQKTEKIPEWTEFYWLDDRTIMVERRGIMVDIEKELIKNGSTEELRLAKRPLEHRLMDDLNTEAILNKQVKELFVDWNFEDDKAYMVLILEE